MKNKVYRHYHTNRKNLQMKSNYIDTVGESVGTATMYSAFKQGSVAFPTMTVVGGTVNSVSLDTFRSESFSAVVTGSNATGTSYVYTATTGTPGTLTTGTNTNGYALGQIVTITTTGTVPTGLGTGTNYFVVPVTGSSFHVATSLANAQAGTAITITGAGVATNTVTPTALAGTSLVQLQSSNDNTTWIAQGTAGTLSVGTAITPIGISYDRPQYHFLRFQVTGVTAGQLVITPQVLTKTDAAQ
jgi:hypothetical protein